MEDTREKDGKLLFSINTIVFKYFAFKELNL